MVNINSLGTPGSIVYLLEMTPAESPSGLTVFLGAYRLFWPTVLSAFVLGMPIGVILYRWYLRRRRRRQPKTEQFVDLLGALATFDHGQTAGKNLNRLSFLFANLPIDSGKLEEIRPNLAAAVEAYHSFTSLQLDEILRQAKRIKIMRPIMNGLEKQVRRLDDLLHDLQVKELIVENGRAPEPSLPSVIDKLQIGIKQIGKCVQANLSTDLTELLPRVIVILNARMRQQRVGFREVISRGGGRFPVFFAERELAVIIEELFTNAFIAMTDSPVKELSMYIEATNGEIVFKLSDTGCGLKSEDPNAVFSREYSTKDEGGGYGLYHVRQEVERFGGRVRIRNNANGPGATVQIYFKTVKNE